MFLGSRVGNSQVLAVPPLSNQTPPHSTASSPTVVWRLSDPALIKSLAPVNDAVPFPDPQGAHRGMEPMWMELIGLAAYHPSHLHAKALPYLCLSGAEDASVLVCCGTAPSGRLARVRKAVALEPYLSDGPQVPVSVGYFPW